MANNNKFYKRWRLNVLNYFVFVKTLIIQGFFYVRPAGRTHLRVQVPYRPGRGNC